MSSSAYDPAAEQRTGEDACQEGGAAEAGGEPGDEGEPAVEDGESKGEGEYEEGLGEEFAPRPVLTSLDPVTLCAIRAALQVGGGSTRTHVCMCAHTCRRTRKRLS